MSDILLQVSVSKNDESDTSTPTDFRMFLFIHYSVFSWFSDDVQLISTQGTMPLPPVVSAPINVSAAIPAAAPATVNWISTLSSASALNDGGNNPTELYYRFVIFLSLMSSIALRCLFVPVCPLYKFSRIFSHNLMDYAATAAGEWWGEVERASDAPRQCRPCRKMSDRVPSRCPCTRVTEKA